MIQIFDSPISGLPNYYYAKQRSEIDIFCLGAIVMTSLVFETVRKYQDDSYNNVTLEALNYQHIWEIVCRTPEAEKTIANESFTPGDFLEMFDHKINKVY